MKRSMLLVGILGVIEVNGMAMVPVPRSNVEANCRTVQTKMDCNSCEYEICTDGHRQWEDRTMRCTNENCVHVGKFKPEDWKGMSIRIADDSAIGEKETDDDMNESIVSETRIHPQQESHSVDSKDYKTFKRSAEFIPAIQ